MRLRGAARCHALPRPGYRLRGAARSAQRVALATQAASVRHSRPQRRRHLLNTLAASRKQEHRPDALKPPSHTRSPPARFAQRPLGAASSVEPYPGGNVPNRGHPFVTPFRRARRRASEAAETFAAKKNRPLCLSVPTSRATQYPCFIHARVRLRRVANLAEHTWSNVAGARGHESARDLRDRIAMRMNPRADCRRANGCPSRIACPSLWRARWTGHNLCRFASVRILLDGFESAVLQALNLSLECFTRNSVHAAPRTLEAAIPRCEHLSVP